MSPRILCILLVVLFCVAVCFYVKWSTKIEYENYEKERDAVERRLTESLKTLCAQLGIGLSYHENLGDDVAGHILYHSFNGRILIEDARIEILEKYEKTPYVLAHELGHYLALKQRNDESEHGADIEADKLCRLILNKKEQELLSICLKIYFEELAV